MSRRLLLIGVAAGVLAPVGSVQAQTFDSPGTEALYLAAVENWRTVDASVLRYSARVQQRAAAKLRTPLRDRTLFHSEAAARVFWDRDDQTVIQMLASKAQAFGMEAEISNEGVPSGFLIDEAFDPGGDRLILGLGSSENVGDEDDGNPDDFYIVHPLGSESRGVYRYEGGDTLTLTLPDGRALRAIELRVIPTRASANHVTGSLWIEPESGALVRAVYRLSQQLNIMEDIPGVAEEDEQGEFDMVPGILKPWTFDLTLVSVDYALWDFQVWLPRSMRVEGQVAVGVVKAPASFDLAYRIESVVTESDVESGQAEEGVVEEIRFESEAEALAYLAELTGLDEEVEYESVGRYLVPVDRSQLRRSTHLPPPIWDDAPGFATEDDLREFEDLLDNLPRPPSDSIGLSAGWGWDRPGALRYNRIEALAIGGDVQTGFNSFLGPVDVSLSGRFGIADAEAKARLSFTRDGPRRSLTLAGYRDLQSMIPGVNPFGFGNSLNALLFGNDRGEYFLGTGAELLIAPPSVDRQSWQLRLYGERQHPAFVNTDVTLWHAFDSRWRFRPNSRAEGLEEAGAELHLRPWWGEDPLAPQFGLELLMHGAAWRSPPEASVPTSSEYFRARMIARLTVPLAQGRWGIGLEAGAGTSEGDLPVQRRWFIGGPQTLRGYDVATESGTSYGQARLEVVRKNGPTGISVFGDAAWAGDRDIFEENDVLYSAGVGFSFLDGLVRLDLARGLRGPDRATRLILYLDAIL